MIENLVGISFAPISDERVQIGTEVEIYHDKDNKYSDRAIAVKCCGIHIGHIGEKNNENHEKIFEQLPLKGTVKRLARLQDGEKFAKFKTGEITSISVEFPMPNDQEDGIQSFTEDVRIQFNEQEHKTTYKGKQLIGGSTYINKWIKEFDAEKIAPAYAKKMGCATQDILNLWHGGGSNSASFGTSIHNALEHYEKYKDLGEIIMQKKDKPYNSALPSHPVMREIVEDFYDLDLEDCEVETEVLVSNVELGFAGFADRVEIIDRKNKICNVADYKINVNADQEDEYIKFLGQFADLPKKKLSKYQLQMSFYARLLELAGWTVKVLIAYVYDGTWQKYELDVLKLDF